MKKITTAATPPLAPALVNGAWRLQQNLHLHLEHPVHAVHLHGDKVTTIASDGARLWRRQDGSLLALAPPHGPAMVASDSDSYRLASASMDGSLRLWDLVAGRQNFRVELPQPACHVALFGTLVAASCGGNTFLLHAHCGGVCRVWQGDPAAPVPPAVDALGLAAREGSRVHLWPRNPDEPAVILAGNEGPITALALGGTRVGTAAADGIISIWHRASGQLLRQWQAPLDAPVVGLNFHRSRLWVRHPASSTLLCCQQGAQLSGLIGFHHPMRAGCAVGHLWSAIDDMGQLSLWRIEHPRGGFKTHLWGQIGTHSAEALSLSSHGFSLAVATDYGHVAVWQLRRQHRLPPSWAISGEDMDIH